MWVWSQDVADLAEECHDEVVESKGSVRLGRRVESIIGQIDQTISQLEGELVGETRLHQLQQERYVQYCNTCKSHMHTHTPHAHAHTHNMHLCRSDMITCAQLEEALAALKEVSGAAKVKRIVAVLDTDRDGNIDLAEIAEVWVCNTGSCVV